MFLDQLLAKEMDWLSLTSGFLLSSNICLFASGLSCGTGDLLFANSSLQHVRPGALTRDQTQDRACIENAESLANMEIPARGFLPERYAPQ